MSTAPCSSDFTKCDFLHGQTVQLPIIVFSIEEICPAVELAIVYQYSPAYNKLYLSMI